MSTKFDPMKVAAARRLCNAALRGPWICVAEQTLPALRDGGELGWRHFVKQGEPQDGCAHGIASMTGWHEESPDGNFVAAARTLLPAALDEIERLERQYDDEHQAYKRVVKEGMDLRGQLDDVKREIDDLRAASDRITNDLAVAKMKVRSLALMLPPGERGDVDP